MSTGGFAQPDVSPCKRPKIVSDENWPFIIRLSFILHFFRNAFELQALQDSLAEVKTGLRPENAPKFQNAVEVGNSGLPYPIMNTLFFIK